MNQWKIIISLLYDRLETCIIVIYVFTHYLWHAFNMEKYVPIIIFATLNDVKIPYHCVLSLSCCLNIPVIVSCCLLVTYDANNKVGSRASTLLTAIKCDYDLLYPFEKTELSNEMISMTERFLERCLTTNDAVLTSRRIMWRKAPCYIIQLWQRYFQSTNLLWSFLFAARSSKRCSGSTKLSIMQIQIQSIMDLSKIMSGNFTK